MAASRGLVQPQTADDVDIGVADGHLQAAAFLQNSQQHGGTIVVKAVAGPPGIAAG